MYASCGIGLLALRQGNRPSALSLLESAVGICQEADLPPISLEWLLPWGRHTPRLGESPTPCRCSRRQWNRRKEGKSSYQALCLLSLGEANVRRPFRGGARPHRGALALARQHQERGHQAYALRLLGEITARHKPPEREQAEAHYRQALTLAEELGMRPLMAHCHLGIGKLYATSGRHAEARAELSVAIELYRAMEMTFWLLQAEAALAKVV